jgi:hypothetical protein
VFHSQDVVSDSAQEGVFVDTDSLSISVRLQNATSELRQVEALLASADLDGRILSDFRDAVNRVRTAAWATQQYAESKDTRSDPTTVLSLLAGERVRAAYQLCRAIEEDLQKPELAFQPGQLLQLRSAADSLLKRLKLVIGKGA